MRERRNVKYVSRKTGSLERARVKSWRGAGGRVEDVRILVYCSRKEKLVGRDMICRRRPYNGSAWYGRNVKRRVSAVTGN
jgi:hypothetical protein